MKTRGKILAALMCLTSLVGCASDPTALEVVYFDVAPRGPVVIKPVGILPKEVNESSGLALADEPGVYWTQNDSGDSARVFAVDAYGQWAGRSRGRGIEITNAKNVDWEDLATDFRGHLLIGAFGNNGNRRRDLAIYQVPQPDPAIDLTAEASARWPFHYPDQTEFPPVAKNFDCEALFVANGKIYLITKHRADSFATLYRLDTFHEDESNELTRLERVFLRGMVTSAASWNDGERIAVLTYNGVWVFDPPGRDGAQMFAGPAAWMPIRGGGQCEAVEFIDRDTLLITNEQRAVFHVPVADLQAVKLTGQN